jgi:hypothetical protein
MRSGVLKVENQMLNRYLFGSELPESGNRIKFISDVENCIRLAGQLYNVVHGRLARLVETWEVQVEGGAPFYAFPIVVQEE